MVRRSPRSSTVTHIRNASVGSTRSARRAGTITAKAAAAMRIVNATSGARDVVRTDAVQRAGQYPRQRYANASRRRGQVRAASRCARTGCAVPQPPARAERAAHADLARALATLKAMIPYRPAPARISAITPNTPNISATTCSPNVASAIDGREIAHPVQRCVGVDFAHDRVEPRRKRLGSRARVHDQADIACRILTVAPATGCTSSPGASSLSGAMTPMIVTLRTVGAAWIQTELPPDDVAAIGIALGEDRSTTATRWPPASRAHRRSVRAACASRKY